MVIYLAGKYSGSTVDEITNNIAEARIIAAELWDKGYTVICPHTNSALFDYICTVADYRSFLFGYMDIMKRCDAVIMVPNWKTSNGAKMERKYAEKLGIPVCEYPDLPKLLKGTSIEEMFYESEQHGISS